MHRPSITQISMNTQKQQFEKHHDFDIPILETNFNLSVKLCIIVQNNALTTFIGSKTTLCFKYPTFHPKETVFGVLDLIVFVYIMEQNKKKYESSMFMCLV